MSSSIPEPDVFLNITKLVELEQRIYELIERVRINHSDLISVDEAAKLLGVTPFAVYMCVKRKRLKYITGTLLDRRDVMDYVETRGRRTASRS